MTVAKPGRVGVLKQASSQQSQKRDHVPMKFKTELKGSFSDYLPQQNYMQISDRLDLAKIPFSIRYLKIEINIFESAFLF